MDRAEQLWIIQSQHESFGEDIARIETNKPIEKCSKLKNLCSYIDDSGVLRLKGRARVVQDVDTGTLDPVLLDGKHQYTRLMIRHYHEKAFHGNTETVVNDLRQKYWVINLRSTVKAVQHSCLICRQRKSQPLNPPTGDLPLARLAHHHRVFAHCGLDYFGPMTVTIGRRHEKRYGALFTCMTTRAVHIELAGSLTTDSAIMALRRMMNRRGNPKVIYSDNGTNFRGANTELKRVLKEVDQSEVSKFLTNERIEWRFNPPLAPHMGGCWERLVRSVKTSLKTVLNEQAPKEETLMTLLTEVEHTLNSRPLTHVSVSESDPESLTPNHFLMGGPSNVPWLGNCDQVSRKCWRDAQRLADAFWKRWLREYLPTLVPRPSRVQDCLLVEGSLVLVADPSLPRNVWLRGVVVKVFPGPDGLCRVADIRTSGGILRRPLTKLIVLGSSE
ncbi:hypothetical protein JYU34_021493 [Plutella xylostella]|uniref:Integrase catalytic domain-containing protein n=1 Tax=Plutella xylostella TaxID=51655 RepID=A0ABQ7PTR8_PLUXY|nr:hypothetical protein JYU34_021493 [Plutella xylostella]